MPNVTVGGTAPAGQPPQDNPVPMGVNDGTNIRAWSSDSSGNAHIAGSAASGAAAVGNPVRVGGNDGSNAQDLKVNALGQAAVTTEGQKTTYSASVTGFTPVATPTDFFNIFGSGTKTVRITHLEISGTSDSAVETIHNVQVMKRSTAGTLAPGALTGLTVVPHDSSDAAGTAVPSTVGTGNYGALGTLTGMIASRKLALGLATETATDYPAGNTVSFDFTNRNEKGIVLRGTAQQLALNLNTEALVGSVKLNINCTWTEE